MGLEEKKVKWGQREQEDFQVKQEAKAQRVTVAYQAQEDHQEYQESQEEMVL